MKIYCRRLLSILSCLVFPLLLQAQKAPVTLKVVGVQQESVPFATVTVVDGKDSTRSLSAIADTAAQAVFELDTPGLYRVKITAIGYKPMSGNLVIKIGDVLTYTLKLEPGGSALDEVTIQEVKPLMRQEDDKTIIDPESLAAASTSGYEVLEKNTWNICRPGW